MAAWSHLRQAIAIALLALAPVAARAQQVELAPSRALGCLTPEASARGEPEYPFEQWKSGRRGRVKVELIFTIPDGRPEVKVLDNSGDDSFVDAVKSHVRAFRVPCLDSAEGPARLVFEYTFRPDARKVTWGDPTDARDAERERQLKCLRHISGNRAPEYPPEAERVQLQGRVLVRARFDSASGPPVAEVFHRDAAEPLGRAVQRWVAGYRLPCLEGSPIPTRFTFTFKMDGEAYGFEPLDLRQVLGVTEGIEQQMVVFDTTTMACPFQLKWQYLQPFMPNVVGEIGSSDAARRPLLAWLRQVRLAVPARTLDSVFADETTLTVPCLKIDLKPKEKS